jgi:hypothetical protein
MAALLLGCSLCACGASQSAVPAAPVVHHEGAAEVIVEPPRAVLEVVSPADRSCTIDAMKICTAYGAVGTASGTARTVSIQVPGGEAITVGCHYAAPGGALVSAAPASSAALSLDSGAFLAAHGFCVMPPGG